MAITVKQLTKQLKELPRAFRIVAAIVAVDIVVLGIAAFWLEVDVDDEAARVTQLQAELTAQRLKVGTTRKEIGRLPELRRLYDAAMSNGLLVEPDRLKLVDHVHGMGDRLHLTDVHYKLSPEEAMPNIKSKYQLVSTPVALANNALLDTDVFSFWQELLGGLQAHYQIAAASIERIGTDPDAAVVAIAAGRPVSLVKAELTFRWMSLRKVPDATKPGDAAKTGVAAPVIPQTAAASPAGAANP